MPSILHRALRHGLGALLCAGCLIAGAQPAPDGGGTEPDPAHDARLRESAETTQGTVQIGDQRIAYRAVAGGLQIDDDKDEPSALMSYTAYFGQAAPGAAPRPVIFFYNGGPGSSTVWLHMGAFGPKRVLTGNGRRGPAAPYRLVDNAFSLLDAADLVFIDAPGTGFGRIVAVDRNKAKEREKLRDKEKAFWGVDQDAQAFARFIRKFLSRNNLWNAPKYLFGESYGTTRSAVLVNLLQQQESIDVNGVMLLSQVLNYGFGDDQPELAPGDDLPYALALPTYAATAWYHGKLPAWADRSPQTLQRLLTEARRFALDEYLPALTAGSTLDPTRKHAVAEAMSRLVGLPAAYLERADLRVSGGVFCNQLRTSEGLTVGRLDTRYSGPSLDPLAKDAAYDPQSAAISAAYVAAYNDYARRVLKLASDVPFRLFADVDKVWDYKHRAPGAWEPEQRTLNVMPDLAAAMLTNPLLKVATFVGDYDLATPFFAAEYELQHLPVQAAQRANLEVHHYPSGHMVYDDPASLQALHDDVVRFLRK